MKEFVVAHWRDLALMLLFVFLVVVTLHVDHHHDSDAREWAQTLTSQVLSAFLGYSAGKLQAKNGQQDVKEKP